jgi:hypothetical protein
MNHLLNQVAPPALPLAREQYDRPYQDQLNNILRLYFVQLASTLNSLVGSTGGRFLQTPYAAIQRTTDKTFTANTATQVTFDQNDYLNGCTNDGTNGITVEYSGLYNYQFSVQLKNTDSQAHTAWIWLRKNTTDVLGTASQVSVPSKHGSTDGHVIAAANFYVNLVVGDYVVLYAAVDNVLVSMEAYPVQTSPFPMPAIPSVVATLSFVSSYEA